MMSELICNKLESTAAYQASDPENVTKRKGIMSPRLVILSSENWVTCRKKPRPENFVISSVMRLVTLRTKDNQAAFVPVLNSMKNVTERGSKDEEQSKEEKNSV